MAVQMIEVRIIDALHYYLLLMPLVFQGGPRPRCELPTGQLPAKIVYRQQGRRDSSAGLLGEHAAQDLWHSGCERTGHPPDPRVRSGGSLPHNVSHGTQLSAQHSAQFRDLSGRETLPCHSNCF